MTLRKREKIEIGSIRSQSAENSLRKRLWTCHKRDCVMIGGIKFPENLIDGINGY